MKFSGYVALALVVSIGLNPSVVFAGAGGTIKDGGVVELKPTGIDKGSPDPLLNSSESRRVMLDAMTDPLVREVFHDLQLKLLQTQSDAMLESYFKNDKVAAPLFKILRNSQNSMMEEYSLNAKSNMLQLVRGLTPTYDRFDTIFVEIGIDAGMSEDVIRNRELYLIPGSVNAATVSGTQNKMIALVSDGLLASMTPKEVAAVLAHEIGHIRAEHPTKGMMNSIMLSLVGELFTEGKASINNEIALGLAAKSSNIHSGCTAAGCGQHNQDLLQNILKPSSLKKGSNLTGQSILQYFNSLQNSPRADLLNSVGNYLYVLVQTGILEKASPASVQYFQTLLDNVKNIGTFTVNPREFVAHAQEMNFAYSRAKEKTADNISGSLTRNMNLASSMAKLMGLKFNGDKETQERIFEQIQKQAKEVQKAAEASGTEFKYVGTTHPSLAHRADRILSIPAYPSVAFANPFLRLLLINEALYKMEAVQMAQMKASSAILTEAFVNSEIEKTKTASMSDSDLATAKAQISQHIQNRKKELSEDYKKVSKARFIHETRLLKELFSSKYSITAKRSPRFENLIQYYSVQREMLFASAHNLKIKIMETGEKATPQNLARMEAAYADLLLAINLQSKFLNVVKERFNTEMAKIQDTEGKAFAQKKLDVLVRLSKADSTETLEKIRREVTPVIVGSNGNSRDIGNKLPLKVLNGVVNIPTEIRGAACNRLFN